MKESIVPVRGHKSCDTKSDIHLQNKEEILELVQVHFNSKLINRKVHFEEVAKTKFKFKF